MKKPIIILTGPTAVGKSDLSISLAKKINGAVISADSMQVYRHMDIGSAKIKKEEMGHIPHYLVDVLNPEEEFHVLHFQQMAKAALNEIYANNQIPIVVGGTGFYIQALLYDINFTSEKQNSSYRNELEALAAEQGNHVLHEMLQKVDPKSAQNIHENNVKRVIRALEFYKLNGSPISAHNETEQERESPYQFAYFVLNDDREKLYERINLRVDQMIEAGLVEEVKNLKGMGYHRDMVSMQGLGYKEILDYLDGKCTLEEAVYIIKRDTRHFAKRQLTWFRREKEIIWVNKPDFNYRKDEIEAFILQKLQKKNILPTKEKKEDET